VLHTVFYGVLVVGGLCLLALAGFELVQRLVPAASRQRHNDVAGDTLADLRRMRLVAAEEGIPGILWAVLIFGGMAAICFTYLFGLESTWAHRLMVATLAAVIGLVLFTVGAMEYPFSGGARIGTGAFELILERFETSKLSNPR